MRPGVVVALRENNSCRLLAREDIDPARAHDDLLMVAIDRAMRTAGLTPRQIGVVAVSAGPGGYTAVRLAVTTAKLIAEATGAACIAIPTSDCVAHRVDNSLARFAVALASKGTTSYVTVYDNPATPRSPGAVIDADALAALGVRTMIADRFLSASFKVAAELQGISIIPPVFDALACAEIAHRYPSVDPLLLAPLYPREPEAVTKWRELKEKRASLGNA